MIEVTFLRKESECDVYLKKVLTEAGANLITKEKASTSLTKGPLILEVNDENIRSILNLIDDREEKFIVAFKNKAAFKMMEYLKLHFDKIFGFVDLSLEYEYNVPLLKNYINQNYSTSTIGLEKLSKDLEKILEFTQTELSRVKEMHDRFVKLRTENLRGAKVQIKFMAGEKSGGEFFDFIETEHEIIIIEAGTDSYIASSMIIMEVENLKLASGDLSKQIPNLVTRLVKTCDDLNSKVNYLITSININTLEVTYYQRGNSKIYFDKMIKNISGTGTFRLSRGERIFFLSEGLIKNWNLHNKESQLEEFLNKHSEMNSKDFINELFFDLAKHKNSAFLLYDALMGVIEVNQNVIHRV